MGRWSARCHSGWRACVKSGAQAMCGSGGVAAAAGRQLVARASADLLMWLAGVELGGGASDGGNALGGPLFNRKQSTPSR